MGWLALIKRAGRWIAGSRIAQALFAAGAFLAWLKWQMVSAKREGRTEERERIERETERQSTEIKERSDATRERNRDLAGDDLRQRMRDQARDDDQ